MNRTNIEYLTHTWNPVAMQCTPVSEGCRNCWHLRMADRLAANPTIGARERTAYAGGEPVLCEDRLKDPLRRNKPFVEVLLIPFLVSLQPQCRFDTFVFPNLIIEHILVGHHHVNRHDEAAGRGQQDRPPDRARGHQHASGLPGAAWRRDRVDPLRDHPRSHHLPPRERTPHPGRREC